MNRGIRIAVGIFLCLCMMACQKQDPVPLSEGNANHALDAWIAQDNAQMLCRYSRGAFPSWHLWREYQHLLNDEELDAIQFVQKRLERRVPLRMRPKMTAVAKFIARHTVCEPDINAVFKQTDNAGNIMFTFQQTVPHVPNVPPIQITPEMSNLDIEKAWGAAFDKHFNGASKTRTIQITVEPAKNDKKQYLMRSNIFDSYATPIQISDFWKKLESWQLNDALELLSIACVQNRRLCDEMTSHFEAANTIQHRLAEEFENDVEYVLNRLTSVSLTGNSRYTVAHLTLTNRGQKTYEHILMKTDEVTPQYCILQAKRTWRDDDPLMLEPGQSVDGWCMLGSNTAPEITFQIVMAEKHAS